MSETIKFNDNGDIILLSLNNFNNGTDDIRVFLPSENINIFPCSRRGQASTEGSKLNYDPEARLNTERTNRLRTAINGFTDSFIDSFTVNKDEDGNELETSNLVFVLKGYRVEIKNFRLSDIADGLGITDGAIYAHLSLHDNVSLGVADYYTEILYRQAGKPIEHNYIDVEYSDDTGNKSDFFMGVSFTKKSASDDYIGEKRLYSEDLPLFVKNSAGAWELAQTSKLPKIRHGDTEDSIKIGPTTITGDFTVKQLSGEGKEEISFEITKRGVGTVNVPLHITKATTVDGKTNLSATSIQSLIVGEKAEGDIYENGTIRAKNNIEAPLIAATDLIATPNLAVTSISSYGSDDPEITVDPKKVLNVNTIKVNTIDSDSDSLAIKQPVNLEKTLDVKGGKTTLHKGLKVNEGLTVSSGDTSLNKTQVDGLTDNGDTKLKNLAVSGTASVTSSLEAGSIQTTGGLTVTGESKLTNVKAAKVTAEALELKDIGQVPALELAHLTETDTYQLRFKFGPIAITEE